MLPIFLCDLRKYIRRPQNRSEEISANGRSDKQTSIMHINELFQHFAHLFSHLGDIRLEFYQNFLECLFVCLFVCSVKIAAGKNTVYVSQKERCQK